MPNIISGYNDGYSTTRVKGAVAPVITPERSAREQLDALLAGEKKTGYRSVAPVLPQQAQPSLTARPAGLPSSVYGAPTGERLAPRQESRPPEKYITYPQSTGYGIYIARELNPEYEMWFESKFGKPYGEGNVEVAPSPPPLYGASNYPASGMAMPPTPGGQPSGGAPSPAAPSWYDMPEWQRTQILSQQLWNAGSGQTPQEQQQNRTGGY